MLEKKRFTQTVYYALCANVNFSKLNVICAKNIHIYAKTNDTIVRFVALKYISLYFTCICLYKLTFPFRIIS